MTKVIIKYSNESEKLRIIEILSSGAVIKNISNPYKSGKYYRVYVDIE